MIAVTHCIAGIVFQTESNVWLPRLQEEPYECFQVGSDGIPDVRHRIHRLAIDSPVVNRPAREKRECPLQEIDLASEGSENSLLRAPAVQECLHAMQDRPMQINASVGPGHVVVYDFTHRLLDFFYTEAYAPRDDRGPEERLRTGDDGPPTRLFRMHEIELDSLTLPPLTEEEQVRFIRIAEISPRIIPKLALLRSPVVRARLQPGLDSVEKMQVFCYLDGLTVWSQTHNTVDYFYPKGGGKLPHQPEERVAFNLRYMFATFLPQFSAMMMHSSGLIRGGRAALFLAPDAGGKSTVLEQATDGLLLNDDQVIVRKEGDTFIAHATPFGRMTSGPCQAPVGGLFVLEKAPHFELTPLKPAPLVKSLWDEHRTYTSILPRPLKQRAFDLFYELCHRVPLYRMRFPKDYVDWAAIDAALA